MHDPNNFNDEKKEKKNTLSQTKKAINCNVKSTFPKSPQSVYSAFQIPANSPAGKDSGSSKSTAYHNNDGSAQFKAPSNTENCSKMCPIYPSGFPYHFSLVW